MCPLTSFLSTRMSLLSLPSLPFPLSPLPFPLSPLQYDLLKNETCDNLVLRLNGRVKGVGAKEVFEKITNYPARPKWDFMCK